MYSKTTKAFTLHLESHIDRDFCGKRKTRL